ncbi:MAG: ParB/RepB/Spo0J family partition protein [Syntrophales bacterium]
MVDNYAKGRIYKLDLAALKPDPAQARKFIDPDSLSELTASVGKYGVLQPILFRQDEGGALIIVAGERRVAAARAAGLTTIPGIFVTGNHREISLVENLLRENLTPVEEAEALDAIMKEQGYSQQQLSEMIGKSQPIISQTLSINRIPADLRDQVRSNPSIPKTFLMDVALLETEDGMRKKFKRYMDQEKKPAVVQERPERASRAEAFIKRMDRVQGEIAELAWQNWEAEDKAQLSSRLLVLRQTADDLLRELETAGEEKEPEEGESPGLS